MVLALSGAEAGKEFLASPKLLGVLLELLPMGSPRIQRQVLHIFRRILPQIAPKTIAAVVPGSHTAVEFFLLCVAKALALQAAGSHPSRHSALTSVGGRCGQKGSPGPLGAPRRMSGSIRSPASPRRSRRATSLRPHRDCATARMH